MTNKVKSLIYLACFICASVVYHQNTNDTVKEDIVTNTYEQEADIVIGDGFGAIECVLAVVADYRNTH